MLWIDVITELHMHTVRGYMMNKILTKRNHCKNLIVLIGINSKGGRIQFVIDLIVLE